MERLRESETVRVIDSLAVYKDAGGNIEVEHLSNLSEEEAIELGSKVGALIGLGIDGEAGAAAGAEAATRGGSMIPEEEAWDVVEDIPNNSAAALLLLEHHWAIPLRAMQSSGRAASASATDSSVRSTLSKSDCFRLGRPSNFTIWRQSLPRTNEPNHHTWRTTRCSDLGESPDAPAATRPGVSPAAASNVPEPLAGSAD